MGSGLLGEEHTAEVLVRSYLEYWSRGSGEDRILCSRRERTRLKSIAVISGD